MITITFSGIHSSAVTPGGGVLNLAVALSMNGFIVRSSMTKKFKLIELNVNSVYLQDQVKHAGAIQWNGFFDALNHVLLCLH